MVAILVFANWGKPGEASGFWQFMYEYKWWFTTLSAIIFATVIVLWYGVKMEDDSGSNSGCNTWLYISP
jgi:hypothetical protein